MSEELKHPRDRWNKDMSERQIEALARDMCAYPDIKAPVQRYPGGIPWQLHMQAYEAYCKRWSGQVALIDLYGRGCRGGFGTEEMDGFLPGWREKSAKIATDALADLASQAAQIKRIAELEAALLVCADELEGEIKDRYCQGNREPHPAMKRKYDRDMAPVLSARAALATPQQSPLVRI